MISKTKIKSRSKKKTNPDLVETLSLLTKNPSWVQIAKVLSGPNSNHAKINLFQIDKQTSPGDTVVIPGKVLSQGSLSKKIKISAFSISERAKNKLKESKSEFTFISEEINKNSKAEGIKILQ